MRIAVAAVSHETNTFAEGNTALDDFSYETGEDVLDSFHAGRSLDGIVDTLEAAPEDVTLVPLVGAACIPAPPLETEGFETVRDELLDRLEGADVDGVCLDLHGSMYVEGYPDAEGELLTAVRDVVGDDVPITAGLDMHATVTEDVVESLDGVAGYRTAPHTDVVETGERAADLLLDDLRGDVELTFGWRELPVLLQGERSETEAEPMRSLIARLEDADERPGVLDANYFLGFPWADTPHAGCHALVTGDASGGEDAQAVATELASAFWDARTEFEFTTEAHEPEAALDEAAAETDSPVVIADTGDIPGAGASEDVTNFLSLIRDRDDIGTPAVAIFADPESTAACEAAGEGGEVEVELGRSVPDGDPLPLSGTVRALYHSERDVTAARIDAGDVDVIVADTRTNLHRDPEFFADVGIDPTERHVVALKSGYLSPAWKDVAARRLFALTPGDTNQILADLPYETVPRPIYPIDEDATWEP
jgi:microcystin degradation protein MlrC